MSVTPVTVGMVSIEQRSQSSVRVVMMIAVSVEAFVWSVVILAVSIAMVAAVSIVQSGFAQHPLNFPAQCFGNEWSIAFAARDTAYVGRVNVQLSGDTFVDAAKNGERLQRERANIGLVTVHDFLLKQRIPDPYQP